MSEKSGIYEDGWWTGFLSGIFIGFAILLFVLFLGFVFFVKA
jgi:heme/copper-type cytochrome/quinol oxidase subunit 2